MGKIVFMDVDGTLLDYESRLPDSARDAIRQARKNGHRVYICTGRSEAEVYDYIWEIGLDGMIGGNGSYVKDGGHIVMWQHITLEQCRHIVDWLHGRGLEFYLEANSGLYASEHFEEKGESVVREYMGRKGRGNSSVTVRSAFPEMIFGDLGVKGIDKGHAVDVLLDYLGASIEDTFAFGDAKVDVPMLEKCAVGVAVASGGEEIKAMADYVTDAVDEDGIYKAFKYFGLI